MRMRLLAAGTRMPDWVDAGCDDYAARLRGDWLVRLPAAFTPRQAMAIGTAGYTALSALSLPHGLARVVVAEALYRAVSLLKGLPYHRA